MHDDDNFSNEPSEKNCKYLLSDKKSIPVFKNSSP